MADARRQWLLRIEDWIMGTAGMTRVDGVNQLFIKRDGQDIKLIIAKVINNFLIAGRIENIRIFIRELGREF